MAETLVFVPAWNEERNLPPVLEELRRELPEADVVVVDDGSTDATARVAREHGADVVSFGENRGLRAAIAGVTPPRPSGATSGAAAACTPRTPRPLRSSRSRT